MIIFWKTVFLLLLAHTLVVCEIKLYDNNIYKKLCTNIFNEQFVKNTKLLIITFDQQSKYDDTCILQYTNNNGIPFITSYFNLTAQKIKLPSETHNLGKSGTYVVHLDEYSEKIFDVYLKHLTKLSFWTTRSKIIIIVSRPLKGSIMLILKEMFEKLWKINVINTRVILLKDLDNSQYSDLEDFHISRIGDDFPLVFGYNPFKDNGLRIIDLSTPWRLGKDDMNALKPLLNLYGYLIKITTYEDYPNAFVNIPSNTFDGPDVTMMNTILQHINSTQKWFYPKDMYSYGYIHPNGTKFGAVGDIVYGRADLTGNIRFLMSESQIVMEYTYPREMSSTGFMVPKAKIMPQYKNIFLPFSHATWFVLIFTIVFAVLCWSVVKIPKVKRYNKCYFLKLVGRSLLDIFQGFLSSNNGTVNSIHLGRLFFLMWTMFSLLITSTFQGSLTSVLTIPKYLKDIDTLNQLADSDLIIKVHPSTLRNLNPKSEIEILRKLSKNVKPIIDFLNVANDIAFNRDSAALFTKANIKYNVLRLKYFKDGYPLMHMVKEIMFSDLVAYGVPKNSVFLPIFDHFIGKVYESGMLEKWKSDLMHGHILLRLISPPRSINTETKTKVLSMYHLQAAFYILIINLILSLILFFMENFFDMYSRDKILRMS